MTTCGESQKVLEEADLLYSAEQLDQAIVDLANRLNKAMNGQEALILCVMNGGVVLAGKLLPLLQFPLQFDAINASRYRGETSGGEIKWNYQSQISADNKNVILVDDILDEGITLAAVRKEYLAKGAKQVLTVVLVDKLLPKEKPIKADFVGVEAENRYLFGYGMDYKNYLRNAPGLFACKEDN